MVTIGILLGDLSKHLEYRLVSRKKPLPNKVHVFPNPLYEYGIIIPLEGNEGLVEDNLEGWSLGLLPGEGIFRIPREIYFSKDDMVILNYLDSMAVKYETLAFDLNEHFTLCDSPL